MIATSEVLVGVHSFQVEGVVRKEAAAVTQAGSPAVSVFPGMAAAVVGASRSEAPVGHEDFLVGLAEQ
jgi:precorrin-3B methylase